MKLYSAPLSMFGAKVEIALREDLGKGDITSIPVRWMSKPVKT